MWLCINLKYLETMALQLEDNDDSVFKMTWCKDEMTSGLSGLSLIPAIAIPFDEDIHRTAARERERERDDVAGRQGFQGPRRLDGWGDVS